MSSIDDAAHRVFRHQHMIGAEIRVEHDRRWCKISGCAQIRLEHLDQRVRRPSLEPRHDVSLRARQE
jgi:hypothetical protein